VVHGLTGFRAIADDDRGQLVKLAILESFGVRDMATIALTHDQINDAVEEDQTLVCVGKFGLDGVPNVTARRLSPQATVTFQTITLAQMLRELVKNEQLLEAHIDHVDGTRIRVERSAAEFIAYLD
jgi:hypothetical protein